MLRTPASARAFIAIATLSLLGTPAPADPLNEPWQSKRVVGNALGDKACAGDAAALAEVKRKIEAGDPIQLNNTGWFRKNCDAFKSLTQEQVAAHQQRAALAGYPIAISNYGNRLIRGDEGVPKDSALGVTMMENAMNAGYGDAAASLARHFSDGKYLPRDPARARAYLKIAEAEGVDAKTLQQRRKLIAEAEKTVAKQADNTADSGGAAQAEQFAALAVSTQDGGFGYAHDYPTADEARARALDECKSRGGQDCDVKMVGRGKGCMAYHSAGGSATAHGWAIGPTTNAVESRAAQECQKRNGNARCGNTSWVCNDRSEAPLDVIYEAPMPAATSGPAIQCRFYLGFQCKLPGNKASTTFAYESFRNGAKFPVVGAPDCQTYYDNGPVLVSYNNGKYARDYVSPTLQGAAKERAFGLIQKMKSYVYGKYPGCSTKGIDIIFGIEDPRRSQKSRYTSKKNRMNFDNGTPRYHWVTLE